MIENTSEQLVEITLSLGTHSIKNRYSDERKVKHQFVAYHSWMRHDFKNNNDNTEDYYSF